MNVHHIWKILMRNLRWENTKSQHDHKVKSSWGLMPEGQRFRFRGVCAVTSAPASAWQALWGTAHGSQTLVLYIHLAVWFNPQVSSLGNQLGVFVTDFLCFWPRSVHYCFCPLYNFVWETKGTRVRKVLNIMLEALSAFLFSQKPEPFPCLAPHLQCYPITLSPIPKHWDGLGRRDMGD